MIYIIGCSFSFWDTLTKKGTVETDRRRSIYSHFLSEKLGMEYKNFSLPGGSNYRICRLINFLDIKKDDIVIVGWTGFDRWELPYAKDRIFPNETVVDYRNIQDLEDHIDLRKVGIDFIEKTENLYTRAIYPAMLLHSAKCVSDPFFKFAKSYYTLADTSMYMESMFSILLQSSVQKLRKIGCTFRMFTAYDTELKNKEILNIPEYLFYKSNMLDELRYKNSKYKHLDRVDNIYWSKNEHIKIADILYKSLINKDEIK